MTTSINSISLRQGWGTLDTISKRAIYEEANETHNVDLVRRLNDLGMKPKVPNFSGPTIISNFMDIATKHDVIFNFLSGLRQTNRLLTKQEFQSLSEKNWIPKSSLNRILGCKHLMQKIAENQLKHMKVPLKVAVVEDVETLEFRGWEYTDNLYDIESDQVKVFAGVVTSFSRTLSRDEIDELIQIIAAANFLDLWPANIIVAKDGVYFIDTEFKSFAGSICWEKMRRFEPLVSNEDKSYFESKVQERIDRPNIPRENNGYDYLIDKLNIFNELSETTVGNYENKIRETRNKIHNLEYVGARKAGSSYIRPNQFTFKLSDILNSGRVNLSQ